MTNQRKTVRGLLCDGGLLEKGPGGRRTDCQLTWYRLKNAMYCLDARCQNIAQVHKKKTAAILTAVIFNDRYLLNNWKNFSFENRSEILRFRALIQIRG